MMLSIIIPTYNAEKYIEKCLNSILDELKENLNVEVILINDGSTDNTKNIYKKYTNKQLKVIENDNHGVSYSRNCGIKCATGKYIMFVDSDDMLEQCWYSKICKYLFSDYDVIYFSKQVKSDVSKKKLFKYIIGDNEKEICLAGPISKLFKTEYLEKNKITFKEDLINGEDMLFNISALIHSSKIKIVNETIYKYRMSGNSATHSFNPKIIESDSKFHNYLSEILNTQKFFLPQEQESTKIFCMTKAIVTISHRISYLKSYNEAKNNFILLKNTFSQNNQYIDSKKLNKKTEKVIIYLFRKKMYLGLYILLRSYHCLNKNKVAGDIFISI